LVILILFEANIGLTDDVPKFNLFDNDNKILLDPDYFLLLNLIKTMLISPYCQKDVLNAKEIKDLYRNQSQNRHYNRKLLYNGNDFIKALKNG
jgi:hypothetical protein